MSSIVSWLLVNHHLARKAVHIFSTQTSVLYALELSPAAAKGRSLLYRVFSKDRRVSHTAIVEALSA
jgi:hypothetical protein